MILDLSSIHQRGATIEHCLDVFHASGASALVLNSAASLPSSCCSFLRDEQLRDLSRSGQLQLRLPSTANPLVNSELLDCAAFFDIARVLVSASALTAATASASNVILSHVERNSGPEIVFEVRNAAEMAAYTQLLRDCGVHNFSAGPRFGVRRRIQTSAVGFAVVIEDGDNDDAVLLQDLVTKCQHQLFSERCVGVVVVGNARSTNNGEIVSQLLALSTPQATVDVILRVPCAAELLHDTAATTADAVELQVDPLLDLLEKTSELCSPSSSSCSPRSAPLRAFCYSTNNNQDSIKQCQARDAALRRATGDVLQLPLQPDAEFLSSSTYEEFERDRVKYEKYEEAIGMALDDLKLLQQDGGSLLICVLGAGRGPLVSASLRQLAERQEQQQQREAAAAAAAVVAFERNKFAFYGLQELARSDPLWQSAVSGNRLGLVCGDGRDEAVCAQVLEAASKLLGGSRCRLLVVSELLGSFGDNELSPECVEGFLQGIKAISEKKYGQQQQHLSFDSVHCIPKSYTSFAALVRAPLLTSAAVKFCLQQFGDPLTAFLRNEQHQQQQQQTAFVVNAVRCSLVSEVVPVFSFSHPRDCCESKEEEEIAATVVEFKRQVDDVDCVSGLLGFFRCCLYQQRGGGGDAVMLSTVPEEHTPGMYSWFPLFMPLVDGGSAARGTGGGVKIEFERERGSGKLSWKL